MPGYNVRHGRTRITIAHFKGYGCGGIQNRQCWHQPMNPIRILLCDDHLLIRASLKSLIGEFPGIDVVGEAGDGREALEHVARLRPNVVVMDIAMPGLNGLEATRRLVKEHPQVRVVMLSMHADESHVLQALRAGASGYVLKGSAPRELEMAIEAVARGEIFLSPAISKHVIDVYLNRAEGQTNSLDLLTPRQREILQLIAEGRSSKQIAQMLDASVKTIESHRASLMERLDIHEVAGLVRYAIRHGLVSPEK
jgi:DNA-binding NarL/FixJ family response regulator